MHICTLLKVNTNQNQQKAVYKDEEAVKEQWEEQRDRGRKRTKRYTLARSYICLTICVSLQMCVCNVEPLVLDRV